MNEMIWFSRINSNHVEVKFELLSWQKKSDTSHSYFYICICVYFCYWTVSYTSYSLPPQALHTCPSAYSTGRGSPLTAVRVSPCPDGPVPLPSSHTLDSVFIIASLTEKLYNLLQAIICKPMSK